MNYGYLCQSFLPNYLIALNTINRISFYQSRLHAIGKKQQLTHKKINLFSYLRLLSFVLLIVLIYLFSAGYGQMWVVASALAFIGLVVLIVYHQRFYKQSEYLQAQFEVNNNEVNVLKHLPSQFDDGQHFASLLPFADDLDLFGKQSVFHLLNRCQTSTGKKLLAAALMQSPAGAEQIKLMQEAVKEISGHTDFRQDIMVQLMLSKRQKQAKAFEAEDNKPFYLFESKIYKTLAWLMPALVLASVIVGLFTGIYTLLILNATLALMLAFRQSKKMLLLGEEVSGKTETLKAYASVFATFDELNLHAPLLSEMQQTTKGASAQFKRLSVLAERFDRRNNLLLYLFSNAFLLYDFHLALAYEGWKQHYLEKINLWLETLGRLELLLSLGTYSFNYPDRIFPEVTTEPKLTASELGHPLIPEDQLVKNDVTLQIDPRVVLITGSNMSGKSTFLRTLGVNVLLAQAGAPVYASRFVWKPMEVLSSLRQSDSLQENTSLFLNELKQLKFILEKVQSGAFCLVLLDEVLRGTNSEDKYTGSYHLIHKLLEQNSLVVMATHDLKLSQLEQTHPQEVVNYCFESQIENGKLHFDYTIKKGVARNRNATWLMKDMGVIDS